MPDLKVLYRYEDVQYAAPLDEFDQPVGRGRVSVSLYAFPIMKRTPKGVWISIYVGKERFVRLNATKHFACPTLEEAKQSFIARKKAQIRIYEARIYAAERALTAVLPTEPLIPLQSTIICPL